MPLGPSLHIRSPCVDGGGVGERGIIGQAAFGRAFFGRRRGARSLGSRQLIARRAGGQKMPCAKPLHRRSAMGIGWRASGTGR